MTTAYTQLTPAHFAHLIDCFLSEQPGPVIGAHLIQTDQGECFVDRWPNPQAILCHVARNYWLLGDPIAFSSDTLRQLIKGMVATTEDFYPILQTAFPQKQLWERVIQTLTGQPNVVEVEGAVLTRLTTVHTPHLQSLSEESSWIYNTWGGTEGLANSGHSWGAFVNGRLASVAGTFFNGFHYEDIGVITEPDFRKMGLSAACTAALCHDIIQRGKKPSWTTSPGNIPSLRVAEKVGFTHHHDHHLHIIGVTIPTPAI